MKRYLRLIALPILFVLLLSVVSCGGAPTGNNVQRINKSDFILNTVVTITVYSEEESYLIDECFEICRNYEAMLSRTIENSEISLLNLNGGGTVSNDTAELIQEGLYYSELSGGAFDITIGAVSELWDFSSGAGSVPEASAITSALPYTGFENLTVNGNEITFDKQGVKLDVGAIAKGYIADKIKEYLLSQGVQSAIISLGGNILLVGAKPDGENFKVGIQYPYEKQNNTIAVIELSDMSVVCSGIYERYFVEDGITYHHILDPNTGYPYNNGLLAVAIISGESTDGDALSTVCFALGLEEGMQLIDSLEGVYAVFITDDFELHYSEGLTDAYTITTE